MAKKSVNVPKGVKKDEYLLAIAIAEQQARGYSFGEEKYFSNSWDGKKCCVMGALKLAGFASRKVADIAWLGNDDSYQYVDDWTSKTRKLADKTYMLGLGFRTFNLDS